MATCHLVTFTVTFNRPLQVRACTVRERALQLSGSQNPAHLSGLIDGKVCDLDAGENGFAPKYA